MMSLVAVGDVFIDRTDAAPVFEKTKRILEGGDVLFANCEGAYGDPSKRQGLLVAERANLEGLTRVRWDILSCANNHILDGGHAAFLGMLRHFNHVGVAVSGAGRDAKDAWKPAVITREGVKLAVVSCSSVFPYGYEATDVRPGVAPMRTENLYEHGRAVWRPGHLPTVRTVEYEKDRDALLNAIADARAEADVVVASFHWGDHTRPAVLTDHERRLAQEAIDGGADAVLGHHHHFLRGIGFYRAKPILYGLGHFVFDCRNFNALVGADVIKNERYRHGDYGLFERRGYPLLPFHRDARMTVIARLRFGGGITLVDLVVSVIDRNGIPIPLDPSHSEGRRVLSYLRRVSRFEGLNVRFRVGPRDSWSMLPRVVAEEA